MKISVAMTTFNGAKFLREQLDSIVAQSRLPDELIVCDDRSTDDTAEILRDYASKSPFPMTVIVNDEQLGSTKNFEKAIGLCSGDLIALSDHDDVWRPQKLAVIEAAFLADDSLDAVITNADLIDENGEPLSGSLWSRCKFSPARQEAVGGARRYDVLLGMPFATGATMVFRSKFRPLLLPFPTDSVTYIHDRWIAVLIAAVGHFALIPDKLIAYRVHRQQQLGVGKRPLLIRVLIPYPCRADAAALAALEKRLNDNPAWPPHPNFLPSLIERRRHVDARIGLSRNPFRRLWQAASEFRTGRHSRYPFGLFAFAKDVVVGTR